MSNLVQKRSVMLLYACREDISSHQVSLILAEKGILYEVEWVEKENLPAAVKSLNPYHTVPMLVDRDLVIYELRIVMEYLDERFPHPPLMPVYPVARANNRLIMYRMQQDWYGTAQNAFSMTVEEDERKKAQARLVQELVSISQVFETFEYFMSEEFSLLDCCLAPILWRLHALNQLPKGIQFDALQQYAQRIFHRPSFQATLEDPANPWAQAQALT